MVPLFSSYYLLVFCISSRSWVKLMRFFLIRRKEIFMINMVKMLLKKEWEELGQLIIHLIYLNHFLVEELLVVRHLAEAFSSIFLYFLLNQDTHKKYCDIVAGGSSRGRRRKQGEDVVHTLKVSLEDLYNGTTKKLSLSRNVLCPKCKGCVLHSFLFLLSLLHFYLTDHQLDWQ